MECLVKWVCTKCIYSTLIGNIDADGRQTLLKGYQNHAQVSRISLMVLYWKRFWCKCMPQLLLLRTYQTNNPAEHQSISVQKISNEILKIIGYLNRTTLKRLFQLWTKYTSWSLVFIMDWRSVPQQLPGIRTHKRLLNL